VRDLRDFADLSGKPVLSGRAGDPRKPIPTRLNLL
jgi:hypothetical protein